MGWWFEVLGAARPGDGSSERVLQVEKPRHQPRGRRRPALVGAEEPGPLPLEALPVDQRGELHHRMAHVDHVRQPRAQQIVLFGLWPSSHHPKSEGFPRSPASPSPPETTSAIKIKSLCLVRGELNSTRIAEPHAPRHNNRRRGSADRKSVV